ncbi:MAG: acylphosphatase [Candidatus Marinimicrobia bacterium]|jgi:acylphosphatase|nr:acylphosphatase [Candidatus Neomarinimicrobiota bacterium]MBT3675986.1 acylphosphatase [Candidatus Neomarinimicrobiota bacterium]MBT3764127.1 acylphosphatase [Candidatus Neomarinimicrobiota bacterium]MBT4069318.1 acylphosphatase [Candidatus Neomarinimicrobiota bacterium]MBT4270476.1 acylphosphatase [Candidatus Neomarinimicrobiota bacterium]
MENKSAANLVVSGKVQGVGFRWYVVQKGRSLALIGYAINLPNGNVEIHAEGNKIDIQRFIEIVKKGPPSSQVDKVEIMWINASNRFKDFIVKY